MERKHVKITACYIVKNEAAALRRSLQSIKSQVDEIVVVDTGSTDDTISIAREWGAKVYHFSWQDDFAAARNFALAQLKGDWVIFLDADEYFSSDTAGNLRRLIEAQAADTNLLLVQRQDVDEQGKTMLSLYVPRIFRIRQDLRYVGAIHEELRQQGEVVKGIVRIAAQDAVLIHTGYAGALGPAKAQRNLTMLLREMENSAEPEHFYGYLAEAYDGLDDRENAMKYAYLDIARGRQAETYASRSYRLLLTKLSQHKRDYRERQRVARMAVQEFPEVPEFHAEYAESLAAGWLYKKAAQEMEKACELGQNYTGMEPSLFTADMLQTCRERAVLFKQLAERGDIIAEKTRLDLDLLQQDIDAKGEQPYHYRYLADCYYALGDYQQAQLYALKAIEAPLKGLETHSDMYYMVLLCMKALSEPENDQLTFAQAASRVFPKRADFPAVMGIIYQEAGKYEQGEKYLSHALLLARQSDGRESSAFGDLEALVYAKLADCEAHLDKVAAALRHSQQAMDINPYEEQALVAFCVLRQDDGEKLAAELRKFFAASEQDLSFLCRFCERNGFGFLYEYYCQELKARYAKDLPRQEYYNLLRQGDWSELSDRLQAGLVHNLSLTIELILRLQREEGKNYRQVERQLLDMLPADMQLLWRQTARREQPSDWPLYRNIWPYILDYGDNGQIVQYAQLAWGQQEVWQDLLAELLQRDKWQAAFELLAMVPQEQADGEFWLNLGRCLYHLGEYPASREALSKARQEGLDSLLLKSYDEWLVKAG